MNPSPWQQRTCFAAQIVAYLAWYLCSLVRIRRLDVAVASDAAQWLESTMIDGSDVARGVTDHSRTPWMSNGSIPFG
jgi:hypothetical protein